MLALHILLSMHVKLGFKVYHQKIIELFSDYDLVYRMKSDYPHLNISINGGIETLSNCHDHLNHVDGVMVGRSAY